MTPLILLDQPTAGDLGDPETRARLDVEAWK